MENSTTLENLKFAIHGLTAPFFCEGSFTPEKPIAFHFKNKTKFEFKVGDAKEFELRKKLAPLLDYLKPAPFGLGKKTRYDRNVRDALQLKAENKGFTIENFDPESAGILEQIRKGLLPLDPNPISAELYSVNAYSEGGHFQQHKDTPRGEDMFGSLVVCLPAKFWNGQFVLNHKGVMKRLDWAKAIENQKAPNQVHWVAFFGDVDHQIERIYGGVRVSLAYLLRRGNGSPPREAENQDLAPKVKEAWAALLADESFLPEGGTLGYPCGHLYHQDARFQVKQKPISPETVTMLKGRDHLVADTALQAKLKVTFNPYLFETCVDETWQMDRFPNDTEKRKMKKRMDLDALEQSVPIRGESSKKDDFGITWIEPPPRSHESSRKSKDDETSDLPAAALLHTCDYCEWGYFGNESSIVDFYIYAALNVKIPSYGKGIRAPKKKAESPLAEAPNPPAKRRKKTEKS